jgi:HEAT repeat protein
VPELSKALRDGDARARRAAAEILGQFGTESKEALPALESMSTKDADDAVRRAAADAVKKIR